MEILYWSIRLFTTDCPCWRSNILSAWRSVALHRHVRPYSIAWSTSRSSSRGSHFSLRLFKQPQTMDGFWYILLKKKFNCWTIFHTDRALCAICCGLIRMSEADGVFHHAGPATYSVKIFPKCSITQTNWLWFLELINWSWKVITGVTIAMSWPCSRHLTIAIDAVTKRVSCSSTIP